ncbi:MAG TPA: hypothetical protein VJC05_00080 [Candidatus Andersenbacteria bacterium]|nr:hypothetical protein [Candidatus Andersenbacteria bacterium]
MPTRYLAAITLCVVLVGSVPAHAQEETEATPTPTPPAATPAPNPDLAALKAKETELATLEEKIKALQNQQAAATNQTELAASQVERLSATLELSELQLAQTVQGLARLESELKQVGESIEQGQDAIKTIRAQLADILVALYHHERTSVVDLMLTNDLTLATLMTEQRAYHQLQASAMGLIDSLRTEQEQLAGEQAALQSRQQELDQLRAVQSVQYASLGEQRRERQRVLSLKQEEQASYTQKLAEAQNARREIERQIFTLRGSGEQIQLNDALSAARFASSVTGVRPSLLLAVLKVETGVGENLGSGVFPDDMHPASRDAFLRLTSKLGLDPKKTPISRRPNSYSGWGGAIGPGQFLPDTWERLEPRVAQLMNKPTPNPFELTDTLVAVGIMLADRGAASPAQETEALARYVAGPNWMYHTWYSRRVLAVAEEYGQEGLS